MTARRIPRICSRLLLVVTCALPAFSACAQATTNPDAPNAEIATASPAQLENAVVKIFSTIRAPDPFRPWSKAAPQEITGSGVVIEGKRI